MAKKTAGPGSLALQLRPEEAKTVLLQLLQAQPRLRGKVDDLIRDLLSEVDAESVASEIESDVEGIDLEALNSRAGKHDGEYTGPDEAAHDLILEAVEPHLQDLQRRIKAGRMKEAAEVCKGIILGLYRAKKNDATAWTPDAPLEIAREAVVILGRSRLPRGFVTRAAPRWARELGGSRVE